MDTKACLSQPNTPGRSRQDGRRALLSLHAITKPSRIQEAGLQIDAVVADEHGPHADGRQRRADSFHGAMAASALPTMPIGASARRRRIRD